MRTWTRADRARLCGGICGGEVHVGDPIQVISLPNLKADRIRCRQCADSDVPPDLPLLVEREPIPATPMVRAGAVKLPFDFKLAQLGRERDPGEEG